MLCQFCRFDNSETGLREGRCGQCGSVLQWHDSSGEVSPEVQAAVASLAARIAPLDGAGGADSEDFQKVAEALRGRQGRPYEAPTPPGPSTDDSAVDQRQVTQQWQPNMATDAHPLRTLKGVSTSSVSDMPLFIHPRAIRRPGDPEFGPAEYELLDLIGEGGVGVVYAARQSSIDRSVAVKMIKGDKSNDDPTRDKFLAEAIVTGDLDHPNIVPVYDLGKDPDGSLFYSMKRVVGTPWSSALGSKHQAENLEILMKVADAIAFAHARGIVHRDIKPENVMLGEFGEVLVMDWGIALPLASYRKKGGVLMAQGLGGTPAYMAPEMATGPLSKIGVASDVYLLGAVLYEIMTGYPPHRGADVMSCVLAAAKNDIAPTDKTGELIDIAMRAMAKRPEDRYGSVQEFQSAVRSYQSHVESVTLCERAAEQLAMARRTGSYDEYARSVFAYEEALTLWSGNDPAREGRSIARLGFAETAWEKGDYDLGLSQADPDDPTHADVIERLVASQRERSARDLRFRSFRALAVVLGAVLLVGGVGFTIRIYRDGKVTARLKGEAEKSAIEAVEAAKKAEVNEKKAVQQKQVATEQGLRAIAESEKALSARRLAERNQNRAEEEQYFAEIGMVNERIAGNAFDVARQVLDQHARSSAARLRHWEWGRLMFLCNGGDEVDPAVVRTETPWTIEAFVPTRDGRHVAAGGGGRAGVWNLETSEPVTIWEAGIDVHAAAASDGVRLVVTAGNPQEKNATQGVIRVWRAAADGTMELAKESSLLAGRVDGVDLSPDGRLVAAACRSGDAVLWSWNETAAPRRLEGHKGTVWSVAFSADGERLVTAGEDESVRIWDVRTGKEIDRFLEHDGPVFAASFSQDGRRVASAGYDRRVLIWPVDDSAPLADKLRASVGAARANERAVARGAATNGPATPIARRAVLELAGHAATVFTLRFSDDDRRVVSGGADNTVRVWDVSDEPTGGSGRAVQVLRGHGGWIRGCALYKTGDGPRDYRALSGAMDKSWRSWSVAGYREVDELTAREEPVRAAKFSRDGRTIAAAMEDGTVQLWSAATRRPVKLLTEGHEFLVSTAFVAPDRRRLFTAAGDNTLRIWDLESGVEELVLHGVGRRGLAVPSPDGRFVLTGGPGKTAVWWDTTSGEALHRLDPHEPRRSERQDRLADVTTLAVSPDGRRLFTGDALGDCCLWDAATGKRLQRWKGHRRGLTAAAFLPGGGSSGVRLVTASADQFVKLWDASLDLPRELDVLEHLDQVWGLAVSPDGRRLATSSNLQVEGGSERDKQPGLWLWDLSTRQVERQLPLARAAGEGGASRPVTVNSLTWTAEEPDRVLVTLADQKTAANELWQWLTATGRFERRELPGRARGSLATAQAVDGGKFLLTAGGKGARLWNTALQREQMSFKALATIEAIDISPDGRWLATAGGDGANGIVKLWRLPEELEQVRKQITLMGDPGKPMTAVAFSPDGKYLAAGDEGGTLHRWELDDERPAESPPIGRIDSPIRGLQFAPGGAELAAACDDGVVRIWKTSGGAPRELRGHAGPVRCVAVSPDGRWVLSGGDDRTVRLWARRSGRLVTALGGHSAPVTAAAFSLDGLRALTGSRDTSSKLWNLFPLARLPDDDLREGEADESSDVAIKEVLTLPRHDREVTAVGFSPDGRTTLTASADFRVRLWPSEALGPTIELSPGGFEYVLQSGSRRIDERAVVSHPCPTPGETLELTISVERARKGDELFVESRDAYVGRLEVDGPTIRLKAAESAAELEVAKIRNSEQGLGLAIEFPPDTAASIVQAVLRSVSFRNAAADAELEPRQVECRLRSSQRAGEATAPVESRTIQVQPPIRRTGTNKRPRP